MGLIMLILIGTVPTVYALNRTMPPTQMEQFITNSAAAAKVVEAKGEGYNVLGDPRPAVTAYSRSTNSMKGPSRRLPR
jgi:PiT family inorganic phosphate transporter